MLNKFVSIKVDDQNIFGIETDKGVIDLTNKNSEWKSLFDVVKNNGFDKLILYLRDLMNTIYQFQILKKLFVLV